MPKVKITGVPKGRIIPQNDVLGEGVRKKGGWLKGAINPSHKGWCTPLSNPHCTGHRRAFALARKKDHGFTKDRGGVIYPFGRFDGEDTGPLSDYMDRGGVIYPFGRSDGPEYNPFFDYGGMYDQNLIGNITNPAYQKKGGNLQYPFQRGQGYMNSPKGKPKDQPIEDDTLSPYMDDGGAIYWDQLLQKDMGGIITAMKYRDRSGFSNQRRGGYMDDGGGIDNAMPYMDYNQGVYKYKKGGPSPDLNPATNHSIADYNPYIYFKNKNWYITQNPGDEHITQTMKPIEREDANIEAEKGEYLVKPGLTGLYKVGGKKHSEGGTPLFAEGGSFIYSNDPKLSIKKHEKELFGFKDGGSNAASKNTPAKVLGRELSPENYNSYIATLQDDKTDKIQKSTAALMLEKLQQKLGQIAYLQETKKGDKVPDFAEGTAPVKKPEFQDIDERMSEYAYGGKYPGGGPAGDNPFLSYNPDMNMSYNGYYDPIGPRDAYPGGRTQRGRTTPTGLANSFNYPGGVNQLNQDWGSVGVDLTKLNPRDAQDAMYNWALKNNPQMLRDMWSQYGNTAQGQRKGLNFDYSNLNDDQLAQARGSYDDNWLGARTMSPLANYRTPDRAGLPGIQSQTTPMNIDVAKNFQTAPTQGQGFQSNTTLPYDVKGKLNDAQVAHLGYLGLQAFNINRYYPKREQVTLPQVRFDQINSQPFVNQINNQTYEANQLAAINPRTSNLVGSNIYGRGLDQTSQTLGNIANQNVQIGNQQNQVNTQQATQQVMANSQFDNQYYNQVQAVNQNFDNERRFANNQFFSTLNQYKSQDDQLAWALASVNKYGVRKVTDPKTGKTYDLPTPLYEQTNQGIRYNADVASPWMAQNYNRINTPQEISQAYQQFRQANIPDIEAQRIISAIIRARGTQTTGQGPFFTQNPYGAFQ